MVSAMIMWTRLRALILKELLVVLRDPRSRLILIVPPILQLFVFSFAATLEVKNVDLVLLNRDPGRASQELVRRIQGSPTFRRIVLVEDLAALRTQIDAQRVLAGIQIGPTFSRDLSAGRPADVQILLDGRRSNASQIVSGYLTQIINDLAAESAGPYRRPRAEVVPRNWFNPNLEYTWFVVPGLIALIAMFVGLIVTGLSVARERELGTFDQLMVSPLRSREILIGKVIPPLLIGLSHVTVYILVALLFFGIPLRGSLLLLYGSAVLYLAAVVGVGLFISSLCATQQQAILGSFLFIAPATLLSGFATPIENMPDWLQPLTLIDPLRYFLVITRGVFLKGLPAGEVARNALPLLAIAIVTQSAAAWLFRRRME
jgi:ABC-2 type transport system permease protein